MLKELWLTCQLDNFADGLFEERFCACDSCFQCLLAVDHTYKSSGKFLLRDPLALVFIMSLKYSLYIVNEGQSIQ